MKSKYGFTETWQTHTQYTHTHTCRYGCKYMFLKDDDDDDDDDVHEMAEQNL